MRIGRTIGILTALAAVALIARAGGDTPEVAGSPSGTLAEAAAGPNGALTVSVAAGEHWLRARDDTTAATPGDRPQVAIWLEDPTGAFVSTIFVTRRAAFEDWTGVAGAEEGETVTPRPLPVWAGKHRGVGVEPMASCGACHGKRRSDDKTAAGDPILEALVGEAPTDGLTRGWAVPEPVEPGAYGIRVEINHWMDPNEAYGDAAASGAPARGAALRGSGQPSLIWGGIVDIGGESHAEELILLGHGRPAGANGEVDADLAGLTTALAIADTIRVEYTRPD